MYIGSVGFFSDHIINACERLSGGNCVVWSLFRLWLFPRKRHIPGLFSSIIAAVDFSFNLLSLSGAQITLVCVCVCVCVWCAGQNSLHLSLSLSLSLCSLFLWTAIFHSLVDKHDFSSCLVFSCCVERTRPIVIQGTFCSCSSHLTMSTSSHRAPSREHQAQPAQNQVQQAEHAERALSPADHLVSATRCML